MTNSSLVLSIVFSLADFLARLLTTRPFDHEIGGAS
jgi:hypothetical protein